MPRTLFDTIWDAHLVRPESDDTPAVLYVDLHLVHEVTSPQAFAMLRERGRKVRRPERTVATMDHSTPTTPRGRDGKIPVLDNAAAVQIAALEKNCADFGVELHKLGSDGQWIVHVIGPELGVTQPGMVIVCGDSHTSTHGAFGALAFGIGTSEVSHVLATQSLLQQPPKTLAVTVEGQLRPGVTAKDVVLAVIARLGIGGGNGHVIEYRGSAIRALSMEERMTVCNMSIEAGARAGMIAPDQTTFDYLEGRPHAPKGEDWDDAVAYWKTLGTDEDAVFDHEIFIDATELTPFVTWGTNPGQGLPLGERVPDPETIVDENERVADGVIAMVVPGSAQVKEAAEAEGLDKIFIASGFDWREPGCSMCLAMNDDRLKPHERCASTSNRNFEGRQGRGGRTHLVSPRMAAAAAIEGTFVDIRSWA